MADPFGMTAVLGHRYLRLGVLLAVLGAVFVVAVIRATGSSTSQFQAAANRAMAGVEVYTTTPSAAHAFLARLAVPRGFQKSDSCFLPVPGPDAACYRRRFSIVLDNPRMRAVIGQLGLASKPADLTCGIPRPPVRALRLNTCVVDMTSNGVRLVIGATSVVTLRRGSPAGTIEAVPVTKRELFNGTELVVTVIGTLNRTCTRAARQSEYPQGCPQP